jgi:predicted amidohydrolase
MRAVDVAAVQVAAIPGAVEHNLARFAALAREHAAGADLIVAPELLPSGYDLAVLAAQGHVLAEPLDGPIVTATAELAAELDSTIVVGLLERDGEARYDSVVVVDANGLLGTYRKTHLYPPERAHFASGDRLTTVPTAAGRLGLMICFEHAFPDVATALALAGSEILVIPSAVPYGYEHLLTLRTRARAQDNQMFAIASNLAGDVFCGGSLIVDPRGDVVAEAGTSDEVVRATIDLAEIEREREREPSLGLRRPELYGGASEAPLTLGP